MPHISKLSHSQKSDRHKRTVVALNDPATRLQPGTTFVAILETPATITDIIFTNIIIFNPLFTLGGKFY